MWWSELGETLAFIVSRAALMEYSIAGQRRCHADTPWLDKHEDEWYWHPLASHYTTLAYSACCQIHAFKEMPEFLRLFRCRGECNK